MKKALVPTSQYALFCDTFNTKLEVKIVQVDGVNKLQLSITSENNTNIQSVSIFKEEVKLLGNFLNTIEDFIRSRK